MISSSYHLLDPLSLQLAYKCNISTLILGMLRKVDENNLSEVFGFLQREYKSFLVDWVDKEDFKSHELLLEI